MPEILLIKTSSLGDVVHNLPVVSDVRQAWPDAQVDWVVEEAFKDIPRLHPGVREVIPVALRRWRRQPLQEGTLAELGGLRGRLKDREYDYVLDTQGLVKSASIALLASGLRCGYAWDSAREPVASLFYQRRLQVAKGLHAVERNRRLAAAALGYALSGPARFGIGAPAPAFAWLPEGRYAVLVHVSSRESKLWPDRRWIDLAQRLAADGVCAVLPWGSTAEHERARRLAAVISGAVVTPRLPVVDLAALMGAAACVVGVDTGLAHLAAALGVPTVGIYRSTEPGLTGLYAAPNTVNVGGAGNDPQPDAVMAALEGLLASTAAG